MHEKIKNQCSQKLRMFMLTLTYVYIAVHLSLWYVFDLKIWGKTAMVGVPSLVSGHINAAGIMVMAIFVSVFIYGRGFCGWACHLRGAVEFADWAMLKLKIPRYVKLRKNNVLLNTRYRWILRIGALYILLIPVMFYLSKNGFHISLNLHTPPPFADLPGHDNESLWNHFPLNMLPIHSNMLFFVLTAFVAVILIIFIMSFVMNYFYGQGAFCRILCPYAVILTPLMNISPYQKKITRVRDCTGCRKCSSSCPQGIDVSREIYNYNGKVRNRECIKCHNCIDSCEFGVLKDIATKATPQHSQRKEYEKKPWTPYRHLQVYEPLGPVTDFALLIVTLITGSIFSRLGGFYFFVGCIFGYIISRSISLFLLRCFRSDLVELEKLKEVS